MKKRGEKKEAILLKASTNTNEIITQAKRVRGIFKTFVNARMLLVR